MGIRGTTVRHLFNATAALSTARQSVLVAVSTADSRQRPCSMAALITPAVPRLSPLLTEVSRWPTPNAS